jgi:hypothetical protein
MSEESTPPEESHTLVPVHACANDGEAQVVISFLKSHNIEAFENSNLPHSIYPVVGDGQVLVHESDAEEAMRLLQSREDQPDDGGAESIEEA